MNPSTSAEALTQLQQAQQAVKNPNQYLSEAEAASGVPTARTTAEGLKGAIAGTTKLLKQVAPSVMGRTAGSLVTTAQAGRQIANEQAPISATLAEQGGLYNEATQNLNKIEALAQQKAQNEAASQQQKLSYLQNLYNTLYNREQEAARTAEETRRFNVQQVNKAATAKPTKSNTLSSLHEDIISNVADFRNKPAFWTEKTLIPELVKAYPELTPKEITDRVYQLRKSYEK